MVAFSYKYDEFVEIIKETSSIEVVQRYLLDEVPFVYKDNPEIYYKLRQHICKEIGIHPQNFSIVGSAQLGFSISPVKLGRPFSIDSDIDIVLVSNRLFENLWNRLIKYKSTSFYKLNSTLRKKFNELQNIIFYGQIRMDKLSNSFDFAKEWWTLFNKLSIDPNYGKRHIRAAIFKSWFHACNYYEAGIEKVRETL
jgi:hypothetical protein